MKEHPDKSTKMQEKESSISHYATLLRESDMAFDLDSNWLITLSDILLLLLIFFLVFLVVTNKTESYEKPPVSNIQKPLLNDRELVQRIVPIEEIIRSTLATEINNLNLEDDIVVIAENREIVITMKEKVTFTTGEVDVLKSLKPMLDNIADIIRKYPGFVIEINGHTDNVPIKTDRYPSNWELSVARATNVLKYIIDNNDIDPSRFSVKGNGDKKPLVPNDTPQNRALNRRVEIRLKEIDLRD